MASLTEQTDVDIITEVATKVIPEHPDHDFDIRIATSLKQQNGQTLRAKYRVLMFKKILSHLYIYKINNC